MIEFPQPATKAYSNCRWPGCLSYSSALLLWLVLLAAHGLFAPHTAFGQDSSSAQSPANAGGAAPAASSAAAPFVPPESPVASRSDHGEITVQGLVSYGNYRIFASTTNSRIYDVGVEYARPFGHFLGARADYAAEVEPMVILTQPTIIDVFGITKSTTKKTVPGAAILPVGIRFLWFDRHAVKPYVMAKGGMIGFTQKVPNDKSTYESFTLQSSLGLQVRMNERFDLRLGLFGDYHFSNGFITPVNPGLDVMNAQMGITYHLGSGRAKAH